MNQALVQDVVSEVMRRLKIGDVPVTTARSAPPSAKPQAAGPSSDGRFGLFSKVDDAVIAATEAQKKLAKLSLEDRDAIVKLVKKMATDNAPAWGKMELEETKIGRLDHKIGKLEIMQKVPGVEFLKTRAFSGSDGVTLEEFAPFGVIGIITPVTHSVPTLTANTINMVAAGNSIVCNAHPSGANSAAHAAREYNKAIAAKYGIENLICLVHPPTLRSAEEIFQHRGISLLVVTGGPAVARAALQSKKRAIVAGPGNPPVVVDETACLTNAADCIVKGAAFDNNLLCIGEKQVFAVESIYDKLMQKMEQHGGFILSSTQIEALTKTAFTWDKENKPHANKDLVGRDASVLAEVAGVRIPPATQILCGETTFDHPFVQVEQMMPFVPFVRARNVDHAIEMAIESEHGYRHTAMMHSRNIDAITKFGQLANVTLYVVNGASPAGLALGGEGYLSYSIATPTGEGVTTPLTFTRFRRVTIRGSLRVV